MGTLGPYVISLLIMLLGTLLAVLPVVPGPPIVWLGAWAYGWLTDWQGIGWGSLALLLLITIPVSTSDWWLSALLLKQGGGSLWSVVASTVGGIIGSL